MSNYDESQQQQQQQHQQHQHQGMNIQAPTFIHPLSQNTQHAVQTRGTPATLNLDDIFGDCFFTPEGDQIFLSENQHHDDEDDDDDDDDNGKIQTSGEAVPSTNASRQVDSNGSQQYVPVPYAGGISTTGLNQTGPTRASIMGPALTSNSNNSNSSQEQQPGPQIIPMQQPPHQRNHLQYAMVNTARRKVPVPQSTGGRDRKMSDQQKSERRCVSIRLDAFVYCTHAYGIGIDWSEAF